MESKNRDQGIRNDTVSVSDLVEENVVYIFRTRYDDLIRAEMEREILFHAYQQMDKFNIENVLDAVFNPQFKYREQGNAQ